MTAAAAPRPAVPGAGPAVATARPGQQPGRGPSRALADVAAGRRARPVLSFELFPPRTPEAWETVSATAGHLATTGPDFVSVTYGASGSAHDASRELVEHLVGSAGVPALAHVTCVGRDETALRATIADFVDVGVTGFLALRGDPPKNEPGWRPSPDSVASGADLVTLVREVTAPRDPLSVQGAGGAGPAWRPDVAVAAFPGGHPRSSGVAQDVEVLAAKQAAGADFALTQLFFDPASYVELVDAARAEGVDLPVVPGILPLTEPATVRRLSALTGVPAPEPLLAALSTLDERERRRAGVAATVALVRAVLDAGAPGLHLYSMNRHEVVLDLLEALDLPAPAAPAPVQPAQRRG